MGEEDSVPVTPKEIPKETSSQAQNNSVIDLIDLTDTGDDVQPPNILCDNNLPRTPSTRDENLKRSLPGSTESSGLSSEKKSRTEGSRSVKKHLKRRASRKLFHSEAIDSSEVSDMIENLNCSRTGILPKNNYDLEKYYSEMNSSPKIVEGDINSMERVYDYNRVIIPEGECTADPLFFIITKVFSNRSNSGYFDDAELDIIFNILTISQQAKLLFVELIEKKKEGWISFANRGREEFFKQYKELKKKKLITNAMSRKNLKTFLSTRSVDVIYKICKKLKIQEQSSKESALEKIIEYRSHESPSPGIESSTGLTKTLRSIFGRCVRLPDEVISLVERIVTLFIPSEDLSSELSNIFDKLKQTNNGTLIYPEVRVQHYPVFESREHLIRYVERKQEWRQAVEMGKEAQKNWEILKTLGQNTHHRLILFLARNQSGIKQRVAVPEHLEKFSEEYVCMKILIACIEIFKKNDSTINEVIQMLKILVKQEYYLQDRKSEWYEELALIEMKKNPEIAAHLTITGLTLANINEAGRHALIKRASSLVRRKDILPKTKSTLRDLVRRENDRITQMVFLSASVSQGNQPDYDGEEEYTSVEYRAEYYYKNNGYPKAWHCEGSLPVTLFTLLFWDELYCVPVPAAYLSAYQKAPLDLYSSDFYKNRKEKIDCRMELLSALSACKLANVVEKSLQIKQHYESLMPTTLPVDGEQLRDIVRCMGTKVVTGICRRLIENFSEHRSGFPHLLVWDASTLRCKFIEIKGPKDRSSTTQTPWLRYLEDLGAVTEFCKVKAK